MEKEQLQLQSRCRQLLREYESILLAAIEHEEKELKDQPLIGDSDYETSKNVIEQEGIKEGMKRLLLRINLWAR